MVKVLGLDGQPVGEIELPSVFRLEVRPDLIRRAFLAEHSARIQPWGPDPMAGKRTTAEPWGKGYGVSRVPRIKGTRYHAAGRAAFVPHAVGGRRAHPPKTEKVLREKINKKEKRLALQSAISATANPKLVRSRGHIIDGISEFPVVVSSDIEKMSKTKEVLSVLQKLSVMKDVERVARSKKIRAGRGKMRGRKYKRAVGPLLVISEDRGIVKAARNIPGVEVCTVAGLSVSRLAPGGVPGRLTMWSENALREVERRFEQ